MKIKNTSIINNIEIHPKENYIVVSVNPKIFSLDIVYSAAYVLMDKAFIVLNGDPDKEILIELKPVEKYDLELLGREFNNELLNYAVYKIQAERTMELRKIILERALLTNTSSPTVEECPECRAETVSEATDYEQDPEQIRVPWNKKEKGSKEEIKTEKAKEASTSYKKGPEKTAVAQNKGVGETKISEIKGQPAVNDDYITDPKGIRNVYTLKTKEELKKRKKRR